MRYRFATSSPVLLATCSSSIQPDSGHLVDEVGCLDHHVWTLGMGGSVQSARHSSSRRYQSQVRGSPEFVRIEKKKCISLGLCGDMSESNSQSCKYDLIRVDGVPDGNPW
jgi:hypothetical protein